MSAKDLPAGDPGIGTQAEAVSRKAQALAAALNRAKTSRRVFFLLLLIFVVVSVGGFYRLYARTLGSKAYLEQLQSAAEQQLERNSDDYTRQVQTLITNVRPKVEEVVTTQFKKDSHAYLKAMQDESGKFSKNLQDQLSKKLDEFHEKAVMKNRAMVEKEFPKAQDPKVQERLVANLQVAIEAMAKKHYVDEMQKTMNDLYQAWGEIKPAPEPAGKDATTIEDQLFATLLELLQIRLTQPPRF